MEPLHVDYSKIQRFSSTIQKKINPNSSIDLTSSDMIQFLLEIWKMKNNKNYFNGWRCGLAKHGRLTETTRMKMTERIADVRLAKEP